MLTPDYMTRTAMCGSGVRTAMPSIPLMLNTTRTGLRGARGASHVVDAGSARPVPVDRRLAPGGTRRTATGISVFGLPQA